MSASPAPRPSVSQTSPAHHGAFDYAELQSLGIQPDDLIDFSVNSNPFGPSPTVRQALANVPLERYPDRECLALRQTLGNSLHVAPDQIVVGNGTAELLQLVCYAYLRPATASDCDRVVIVGPTFGEYRRASELMGAQVYECRADASTAFAANARAIAHTLQDIRPRLFFLCNPNNPTGTLYPPEVVAQWGSTSPETLLVIDEAYIAFAREGKSALELGAPNVLIVRSMTKDYALAGLRLGYAVGPLPVVNAIASVRPAWNVSALAQAAGIASLRDTRHLEKSLAALQAANRRLLAGLQELHLAPVPSATHFFILQVGNGAALRRALLAKGIQVRDCASFGLPEYIRIATRRPRENRRLIRALREIAPCRD